ncbi:uncharacterized protein LOC123718714 [Pieris brassicae]|uniref:Uncharacterized protein n=1 Tax=Pieris brassicae TaxID=7116 RepID=A0A9P0XLJ7_PIEBR|nr:uncharacterized protein LOC123718714 [Pieris brassicae]CAH4038808.1 unnamed protein product [Pieris brassicae]
MKFNFLPALFVFGVKCATLETTKEPSNDANQTTSYKISLSEYQATPVSLDKKRDMKSLWVYHPPSLQSQGEDQGVQNAMFKAPHLLTRLAKPFNFGIDPYFSKDYFAPFERRNRPITLVAFRKNALMPRRSVRQSESAEVAELQSPFNEVGALWREDPDIFNL